MVYSYHGCARVSQILFVENFTQKGPRTTININIVCAHFFINFHNCCILSLFTSMCTLYYSSGVQLQRGDTWGEHKLEAILYILAWTPMGGPQTRQ